MGATGGSHSVAGTADRGGKSTGKESRLTQEGSRGRTMTTKDVQALRKELLELLSRISGGS